MKDFNAWSKSIPSEGGLYWHWNEDEDCAPVPYNINRGLTDGKTFATPGQYGMISFVNCEDMGGWWMPCQIPAPPMSPRNPDLWPSPPLTEENIARLKARNLKEFPHHEVPGGQSYLCESCDARRTCPFSMDPYNTVGDYCLADK